MFLASQRSAATMKGPVAIMVFIRALVGGERAVSNSRLGREGVNWRQQLIYDVELTRDNFDKLPRMKDEWETEPL